MAKSGIAVTPELDQQLRALNEDSSVAWIRVSIQETSFKLEGSGKHTGDDLKVLSDQLPPREPIYFLYRLDFGANKGKFIVIFYCPDVAKVKDRMLYASTIAALKKGFGDNYFANPDTYRISTKEECSAKALAKAREEIDDREIMTNEELYRHEASKDSVGMITDSKQKAIHGLPIKVKDGASAALTKVKEGKIATVLLSLDPVSEELGVVEESNDSLEDVSKKMDNQNPRFVLHNFVHERDGSETNVLVFVYYCPNTAKPRLKMFFSSCKAIVVKMIEDHGLPLAKKLEASEPAEISSQATLDELYPKAAASKAFAKPKAAGARGGARRGPSGFSASNRPGGGAEE